MARRFPACPRTVLSHVGSKVYRPAIKPTSSGSGIATSIAWLPWPGRLARGNRRERDEEDVALSAFQSFCERAGRGQFPQLDDRDDLWRLLATITARKAIRAIEHQTRQKRGGGRVLGESVFMREGEIGEGMAQFLSREPTPEAAAEFAEAVQRLLDELEDTMLKTIALRRLEGHSSQEIGAELGISARSVDRKLELIREIWGGQPE